jgi:hypothetical protein
VQPVVKDQPALQVLPAAKVLKEILAAQQDPKVVQVPQV